MDLPPRGSETYFIGYLSGFLLDNGRITPENWASALLSAEHFQREAEIHIRKSQTPLRRL